jgi:hypothetical protein
MTRKVGDWETQVEELSKHTQALFTEEVAKMESFLENFRKVNGDSLGNMISEIDLQKQVDLMERGWK